jgi:excisionase family DNA binding protein
MADARTQILTLFRSLPVEGRAPMLAALAMSMVDAGQGAASGPQALLTPEDLAGVLKVSRFTVYTLLREQRIRSVPRPGGRGLWRVRPSDLAEYQRTGGPVAKESRARGPRRLGVKVATESRPRGPRRLRDAA